MKLKFFATGVATALASITLWAATDPVLMTINGKDVKLSEFEYLYKKNSNQQAEKEPLDKYVDRFVTYKMKVAEAERMGIDTLPRIKREIDGYKADLTAPYMVDSAVYKQLLQEAYARMKRNVDVSHIMLQLGNTPEERKAQLARIDSIRQRILAGEDFAKLAKQFSIDRSAKTNGGHIGFIAQGIYPYDFEAVAFSTPKGQVSAPFKTDFGYHIVKNHGDRPDQGTVHVRHILLLFPRNASTKADTLKVKNRIDSIYTRLQKGDDFAKLALKLSDDKQSAMQGGLLPWFGSGRMVPQFEAAAFALQPGETSKPIKTVYGYHIINMLERKGVPSFEEAKADLEAKMQQDARATMPQQARMQQLKKEYNLELNTAATRQYLTSEVAKNGGQIDSAFVQDVLMKSNFPIFKIKGIATPMSAVAKYVNTRQKLVTDAAINGIIGQIDILSETTLRERYADDLMNNNEELGNLLREYRDGTLLFEASNKRVWDGASQDTTGLKNFFNTNRSKYQWAKPHFKGIILMAKNDSILKVAQADFQKLKDHPTDTVTTFLHQKYKGNIKMVRMTVEQGENPMVDHLMFNGPKAPSTEKNYPVYFLITGKVLPQPETIDDVRGQVTSDYQSELEKRWVAEMKKRYKVKINKKVLSQVRP